MNNDKKINSITLGRGPILIFTVTVKLDISYEILIYGHLIRIFTLIEWLYYAIAVAPVCVVYRVRRDLSVKKKKKISLVINNTLIGLSIYLLLSIIR
jgi:hypothetical protein